jgi:hypothetical protein
LLLLVSCCELHQMAAPLQLLLFLLLLLLLLQVCVHSTAH